MAQATWQQVRFCKLDVHVVGSLKAVHKDRFLNSQTYSKTVLTRKESGVAGSTFKKFRGAKFTY